MAFASFVYNTINIIFMTNNQTIMLYNEFCDGVAVNLITHNRW